MHVYNNPYFWLKNIIQDISYLLLLLFLIFPSVTFLGGGIMNSSFYYYSYFGLKKQ